MMRVMPQTRDEKLAMYMKLTKRELAEMLVGCNDGLSQLSKADQKRSRWAGLPPLRGVCGQYPKEM